jgi:hypothetical protein
MRGALLARVDGLQPNTVPRNVAVDTPVYFSSIMSNSFQTQVLTFRVEPTNEMGGQISCLHVKESLESTKKPFLLRALILTTPESLGTLQKIRFRRHPRTWTPEYALVRQLCRMLSISLAVRWVATSPCARVACAWTCMSGSK